MPYQYQNIKDEFILEIAELDMNLEMGQEIIATLNKMAEVFIKLKGDDYKSRKTLRMTNDY